MIDMSKRYRTLDHRPVRILCTDRKDDHYPVVGLITESDGREVFASWSSDGRYFHLVDEHANDLLEFDFNDLVGVCGW